MSETAAAGGFLATAARQAVALMLLATLPAAGSWVWLRPGKILSPTLAKSSPAATATPSPASADAAGMVDLAQAMAWGKSVLWVDARRKTDFESAHIPGALLLNEDDWSDLLPAFLERWTPDSRVVVYCDGGACQASRQVSARLRDTGVSPVYALRGGWPAWEKQEGKPRP